MQIIGSEVTSFLSLNIKETLGDEGAFNRRRTSDVCAFAA